MKKIAENITKMHIYRTLLRSVYVFYDINKLLPKSMPEVNFDVVANVGQSSKKYAECFPNAKIYSFEPINITFNLLEKNIKKYCNIYP